LFRYQQKNIRSLSGVRTYATNVPEFLKDRPLLFRNHCTKRIPSADDIPFNNITELPKKTFKVTSEDQSKTYNVDLSGSLPSCSCPDWKRYHFPCKHILCILIKVPSHGWDTLETEYRHSPYVNIDHFDNQPSCNTQQLSKTTNHVHVRQNSNCARSTGTVPVAMGSRCKMLASSIHGMLHLVGNSSDYETLFPDLLSLHAKIRAMVPKEAGLLRRPARRGRKNFHMQHGLLKTRRKYRKRQPKINAVKYGRSCLNK